MRRDCPTLVIVHLGGEYKRFHRRHFYQALAGALPGGWAMVCVNRPVTMDLVARRSPRHWLSALRYRQPRQLNKSLFLYTPLQPTHELVADRLPGLRAVNRLFLHRQLSRAISGLFGERQRIISWVSHPIQSWVWGAFSDEKKVYECYDEYAMNPDGSVRTRVQRMERGVLRDADLTLVTAEELAARRRQDVGHVVFVPNGVAEDFMRDPMAADFLRHTARKPCIGYLGHLRSEVDVDLLVALAAQNPQWHFLLVGPVQRSEFRRRLDLLPNVEFAGPQPYGSLPSLLRRFDVGLIPFVLNSFTLAINPLKAYEYMAAGVPIVASNLPELLRFRDIIRMIENTPAAFGKAIAETLADDRAALSLRLTTRAREYTWERISREVVVPELVQLVE